MHTTETPTMSWHHDGDYSGLIGFTAMNEDGIYASVECEFRVLVRALMEAENNSVWIRARRWREPNVYDKVMILIEDLRHFISCRVLSERITKLENLSIDELDDSGRQAEYLEWAKED